jgi:hypothetical protein
MKTLHQFMAEAVELLPAEEINEDVLITEDDIIDSIVEALDGEQVTEEQFVEIYNQVIEQLSGEEILDEEELEEGVPGTTIRVSGTGSGRQYSVNGQPVSQQQGQNTIAAGMNRAAASNPALAAMRAQSSSSTTTSSAPRPSTPIVAPRPVTTGTRSYSGGSMIKNFEEELAEEHDIELKPHPNGKGTHYVVHKISKGSGITSDQLKSGETINDSHVDDLRDMDYKVKIHSGKKLNENIEDEHSEAYGDHEELISQVKDSSAKKKFAKEFEKHADNFSHHYDNEDDDQAEHALANMHEVNDRIRAHLKK